MLLELEELFDELLEELFDEPLLLEFDELLDERLLDRLLLELVELLDDRLLLLLADELDEAFEDELADPLLLEFEELFDELFEELFEELLPARPPLLRGPLRSERLLLELDELLDEMLLDRLLAAPACRSPRSSPRPTAAAADFMPRSQPLKKRCTGVSPRGADVSWRWSSAAGMPWACTLLLARRVATAAARARRGVFM